jgi:hypothetical protein
MVYDEYRIQTGLNPVYYKISRIIITLTAIFCSESTCETATYQSQIFWAKLSKKTLTEQDSIFVAHFFEFNSEIWVKFSDLSKIKPLSLTQDVRDSGAWYLKWDLRRVLPVSRGCLLLHSTWSYLCIFWGPCCPTLGFVIAFWITIAFYTLLTSLFCTE